MRRTPTAALAAVTVVVALAAVGPADAFPDVPVNPGGPIPSLPSDTLVPRFEGRPAIPRPMEHPPVPQHPFLSPNGTSSMHNDAYSTDAYDVSGPLGRHLSVTSRSYGVRECATMTFDSQDRIEALCGGLEGFTMMLIHPETLEPISELTMPGRDATSGKNPLTDICGGTYFFLDGEDRAFATTTTSEIWEVRQTQDDRLEKVRSWPLAPHLPEDDCLVAVAPDWQGRVWFFSQGGTVGTLDRRTGRVATMRLGKGEEIVNSVSTDESGGVYPVSTHAAYRLDADRRGRVPVLARGASTTENSLVAAGRSLIIENNYGYEGPQSTMLGRSTRPGVARVLLRRHGCRVAWTSSETAPTSVPKASHGNGLLYVYTKPPRQDGIDAWYLTAIDIRSGKTVWSRLTGTGTQWNNHYAAIYLGPDGTAYVATLAGLVRVADGRR